MNQEVRITSPSEPKLNAILQYLSARTGKIVTRDELLENVWGEYGSDEALNQAISKLRKYLKKHALENIIETLPREGYRLTQSLNLITQLNNTTTNQTNVYASFETLQANNNEHETIIENIHLKKENKLLKITLAVVSASLIIAIIYTVYHSTQHVKVIKHRTPAAIQDNATEGTDKLTVSDSNL